MSDFLKRLDTFTSPHTKNRKKRKKEQKRLQEINRNKQFAKDRFNVLEEKRDFWIKHVKHLQRDKKDLNHIISHFDSDKVGYIHNNSEGLQIIYDVYYATLHCNEVIQKYAEYIGWNRNCTGYDPISVSFSVDEIISSTIECVKLMAKQMILYRGWID